MCQELLIRFISNFQNVLVLIRAFQTIMLCPVNFCWRLQFLHYYWKLNHIQRHRGKCPLGNIKKPMLYLALIWWKNNEKYFSCQKLASFAFAHILLIFVDISKLPERGEIFWTSNKSLYNDVTGCQILIHLGKK